MPKQQEICLRDDGQGIAEYAILLLLILALVVGARRLVNGNGNLFSKVADELQQQSNSD